MGSLWPQILQDMLQDVICHPGEVPIVKIQLGTDNNEDF